MPRRLFNDLLMSQPRSIVVLSTAVLPSRKGFYLRLSSTDEILRLDSAVRRCPDDSRQQYSPRSQSALKAFLCSRNSQVFARNLPLFRAASGFVNFDIRRKSESQKVRQPYLSSFITNSTWD
jgi:hypothetical protein